MLCYLGENEDLTNDPQRGRVAGYSLVIFDLKKNLETLLTFFKTGAILKILNKQTPMAFQYI